MTLRRRGDQRPRPSASLAYQVLMEGRPAGAVGQRTAGRGRRQRGSARGRRQAFDVPESRVRLRSGAHSRLKLVEVDNEISVRGRFA